MLFEGTQSTTISNLIWQFIPVVATRRGLRWDLETNAVKKESQSKNIGTYTPRLMIGQPEELVRYISVGLWTQDCLCLASLNIGVV